MDKIDNIREEFFGPEPSASFSDRVLNGYTNFIEGRGKYALQTAVLLTIALIFFSVGRGYEQGYYESTLENPYPLKPQSYWGGIKVDHLKYTW